MTFDLTYIPEEICEVAVSLSTDCTQLVEHVYDHLEAFFQLKPKILYRKTASEVCYNVKETHQKEWLSWYDFFNLET